MTTSPSSIEVTSTSRGVELAVEVPKRWWQFWLPDVITVPLSRGQVIVLYQSIHKHAQRTGMMFGPGE